MYKRKFLYEDFLYRKKDDKLLISYTFHIFIM